MTSPQERKRIIQDAVVRTKTRRRMMDKIFTGMSISCIFQKQPVPWP